MNIEKNLKYTDEHLKNKGHLVNLHFPKEGHNFYNRLKQKYHRFDYLHIHCSLPALLSLK